MGIIRVPIPTDDEIAGRTAIESGEPWIVPEAIEQLAALVAHQKRAMEVLPGLPDPADSRDAFEWGAGGSAVWFTRHFDRVTVIEETPRWTLWTEERVRSEGNLDKLRVLMVKAEGPATAELIPYVRAIAGYPDNHFALISIDGNMSMRRRCLEEAIPRLAPGGILVLDNNNSWDVSAVPAHWAKYHYQTTPTTWMGKHFVWETLLAVKA